MSARFQACSWPTTELLRDQFDNSAGRPGQSLSSAATASRPSCTFVEAQLTSTLVGVASVGNDSVFDLDLIDSQAGDVRDADLIFIFGTRHWAPAELAADLYHAGRAPFIVTTGGPDRHPRRVSEAVVHQRLLVGAGVPEDAVIVEDRSITTVENVTLSAPLIAEAIGKVRSVIAVVKWYHRRALVTMARHAPNIERIYAADYEPFNADSRVVLSRRNWADFSPGTVERETRYMRELEADGFDMLQRADSGWVRNAHSSAQRTPWPRRKVRTSAECR